MTRPAPRPLHSSSPMERLLASYPQLRPAELAVFEPTIAPIAARARQAVERRDLHASMSAIQKAKAPSVWKEPPQSPRGPIHSHAVAFGVGGVFGIVLGFVATINLAPVW